MDFSDDFNRADDATALGGSWTALQGTWGIASNTARLVTNDGDGQNVAVVDVGVADGVLAVTVPTVGGSYDIGLVFRVTDVTNYYLAWFRVGSGFRLYKRVAGALTVLASSGNSLSAGDVLSVEYAGSAIVIEQNGTAAISHSDSTYLTPTQVGLRSFADVDTRFDDFTFTGSSGSTRVDWMGGTRVAGGVRRYHAIPSGFTPPGRPE